MPKDENKRVVTFANRNGETFEVPIIIYSDVRTRFHLFPASHVREDKSQGGEPEESRLVLMNRAGRVEGARAEV